MDKVIKVDIGDVEILAFNDYTESQNAREFFPTVTEGEWKEFQKIYEDCITKELRIDPWQYWCYLIKDKEHTILVDTGVGSGPQGGKNYSPDWIGNLPEALKENGIQLEDITDVVFTHFHGDHVGWATTYKDGEWVKTFPNARYIGQQADYDAYHNDIIKFAFPEGCFEVCIQPLYDRGEIDLLTIEKAKISESVYVERRPGHTPGAVCIIIKSQGETCVLAGDCLANPLQITSPEKDYIWDVDKKLAAQTKMNIMQDYGYDGVYIGACHFGIGRVEIKNKRRYWKRI